MISYLFNKSRAFFISLLVTILYLLSTSNLFYSFLDKLGLPFYYRMIGYLIFLLLPINLVFFSFAKERGILTSWGFSKIIFLLCQLIGLDLVLRDNRYILEYLSNKSYNLNFALPDYHILFYICFAFLVLIIKKKDALDCSFMGILIILFFNLYYFIKEGLNFPFSIPLFSNITLILGVLMDASSRAYKDELTKLPSRRALQEEMLKLRNVYSIAMLDIDLFKKFNDKYGHDVGDQVLQMISRELQKTGGGAKAFRYGGEEFTLIFPDKSKKETLPHLEDLRKRIAKRPFVIRSKNRDKNKSRKSSKSKGKKQTVNITVSIGVAEKNKSATETSQVIKLADKALYKAKRKGRNRVC